jgi:hypothetical protein
MGGTRLVVVVVVVVGKSGAHASRETTKGQARQRLRGPGPRNNSDSRV